jgi:uncharacterized RDD family membrane protein YckC
MTLPEAPHSGLYATFARRFNAIVLDGLILIAAFVAIIILISVLESDSVASVGVGLIIGGLILYDPIFVAARGGTIGHYALNLRVLDVDSGQRLGLLRAVLRFWLKWLFGFFAFFFMVLTRRHQALHDVATRSAVVIYDARRAQPHHYVAEKPADFISVNVPWWRRTLVTVAYSGVAFVFLSIASVFFTSPECIQINECSATDNAVGSILGLLIVLTTGSLIVLGWRGLLPGARNRYVERAGAEGAAADLDVGRSNVGGEADADRQSD